MTLSRILMHSFLRGTLKCDVMSLRMNNLKRLKRCCLDEKDMWVLLLKIIESLLMQLFGYSKREHPGEICQKDD